MHVSIVVFPRMRPVDHLRRVRHAVGRWLVCAARQEPRTSRCSSRASSRRDAGPMELITGVSIVPQDTIADVEHTDIVFVPNMMAETAESCATSTGACWTGSDACTRQGAQLYCGLRRLAGAGRGRAARGLRGDHALELRAAVPQEYPDVTLLEERILVQSGAGHSIVCCGGASSWQDLALLLIARHGGTRGGDPHLQAVPLPVAPRRPAALRLDDRQRRPRRRRASCSARPGSPQNYERADIVAEMVRASGLPKRTFDRRFTGGDRLFAARLYAGAAHRGGQAAAGDRRGPVDAIGREVGYEDIGLVPPPVPPARRHDARRLPEEVRRFRI